MLHKGTQRRAQRRKNRKTGKQKEIEIEIEIDRETEREVVFVLDLGQGVKNLLWKGISF